MITDKQRQLRKSHIGSSDVAAILDMDPFKNKYDVWLEKTGKLDDKQKTGRALNLGTYLEKAIISLAEGQLGKIIRNQYRVVKNFPLIAANTDGIVQKSGEPVEAKSTNITYRAPETDEWGEEGTDQVPDRIIIQGHVQMMACEADVCHNPVIIGGRGFVIFHIPLDKFIAEHIIEKVSDFWNNNVQKDIPPENCVPSIEIIRRVQRVPESIVPVEDILVEHWKEVRIQRLALEHIEEQAAAELLAKIGTAEAGQFSGGLVTFYNQTRKAYNVPETTFRVLRIKKRKDNHDTGNR